MGNGKLRSALLVEIIIAVLFFSLSAAVILEAFAVSYKQSNHAATCDAALAEAQNISELMYASDDLESLLEAEGFERSDVAWTHAYDDFVLGVEFSYDNTAAGRMLRGRIVSMRDDETLLELPLARYIPGEVAS